MRNSAGGRPINMAMACSNCARCTLTLKSLASVLTLGFGGRDVRGRDGITRFELVLHDVEGFFVFLDGTVQQLDQRVGSSQIEISERELGLGQELDVVEIGRVRLRRGGVALDLTADLAPNIERPAAGKLRSEGVRICASARRGGDCAGAAGFGPVIRPRGVIVGVHDRKQGCLRPPGSVPAPVRKRQLARRRSGSRFQPA